MSRHPSGTLPRTLELLESRCLLAGDLLLTQGGTLLMLGTARGDVASVSEMDGQLTATLNGITSAFPIELVHEIRFQGYAGNDTFRNDTDVPCVANGHAGHDTLTGGAANDRLNGGAGRDELAGRGGNDLLLGLAGRDRLDGGIGDDRVYGHGGDDILFGKEGDDDLRGGLGDDHMEGGAGVNTLRGGRGNDTIVGGNSVDSIFAGLGNDTVHGGDGSDRIEGGPGADRLDGELGNDVLLGRAGRDALIGGEGDDVLDGGGHLDQLEGGPGNNRLVVDPRWGEVFAEEVFEGQLNGLSLTFDFRVISNDSREVPGVGVELEVHVATASRTPKALIGFQYLPAAGVRGDVQMTVRSGGMALGTVTIRKGTEGFVTALTTEESAKGGLLRWAGIADSTETLLDGAGQPVLIDTPVVGQVVSGQTARFDTHPILLQIAQQAE